MADNSPLLRTWSGLLLVLTLVFGGFQSAVAAATADGYHVDAYTYDDQPHTAGLADSGGPLNQKLDSASATASADRGVRVEEIETASWAGLRQRSAFVAPGSLRTVGSGFSASEQRVAQLLADGGDTVLLREATGVGRTSDLLVNGVPYDVYTPTTGNIDRIVSAVSSKGSQVQGGGVIIDLADSPLTTAQLGDILPRVQGVTSQISDIRVVGG
jgi:Contact-dependent growth inhibition CdiA C-terminal domain